MGKHHGSSPLKEINVEMHSRSNAPGYTRDDVTDDNSECGMVSEITTITRAVDLGPGPVEPTVRYCAFSWLRPSRIRVFLATCLLVVACLLAVVIVRHRVSDDSGSVGGADAGTVASVDSGPGEGKIVEFTVANLNTNANNCTQVGHELQCVPYHNSATDKFRIRLRPEWAPLGVDRFEYLTASGFWRGVRVFRIVPDFVSQFGISSDPDVQRGWSDVGPISDDPVVASNGRGTVTFATSGSDTRTTQIFINTNDNWYLDGERTITSCKLYSPQARLFPCPSTQSNDHIVAPVFFLLLLLAQIRDSRR